MKADERPQNVEKSLESVEWKKEKIEVVKGKKDVDNDFFAPKKAPKKNVQGEKASAQATSLNHQIEIIGFFENVKVPPPLSTSKLDETIKQLQEKREYFNNLKADESKPEDQKAKEQPAQDKKVNKFKLKINCKKRSDFLIFFSKTFRSPESSRNSLVTMKTNSQQWVNSTNLNSSIIITINKITNKPPSQFILETFLLLSLSSAKKRLVNTFLLYFPASLFL